MAGGSPKCLLEFSGRSLLTRHLHHLAGHGVQEVCIVTGYESEQIEQSLRGAPVCTQVRFNPRFTQGSMISLWAARDYLADKTSVLLLDADVLCDARMLGLLSCSRHPDCLLVDPQFVAGDEPVTVCIHDGRIVEFRKRPDAGIECDLRGESVGFFRFSDTTLQVLMRTVQGYIDRGDNEAPHEAAIRDLILAEAGRFGWEDIGDLPWLEIDFPEDVERARRDILPRLQE